MSKITADGKIENFVDQVDGRLLHAQPGAYGITHVPSKTVYVGSTSNLSRRKQEHTADLRRGGHSNRNLQEKYNQDPNISFGFQITRDAEEARDIEQTVLDTNAGSPQLLNVATDARASGRGLSTGTWDEERRRSYGKHVEERWQRPEYREKLEAARRTEESRERVGRWSNQLWTERRDEMIAAHNTPEAVENHRAAVQKRWDDPESRAVFMAGVERTAAAKRKPVVVNGVQYDGVNKAAEATGVAVSTLCRRLKDTSGKYDEYRYV